MKTKVFAMTEPLTIDVVSDVVCPWCFIGKKRLEKAIALRPDIPVEVRWHPYFLNDWVPREGISRDEYLTKKFGSPERYKRIAGRVADAAAAEGLTYNVGGIARQPNTLDCHRLILWARNTGDPARMKQRLMELYFTEGADLTDREVLVQAAADCGMDADLTRELLASDRDVERVTQEAEQAKEAGIDGVPCFILGGVMAVSGAQDPAYLADAMDRAVQEVAKRGTAATGGRVISAPAAAPAPGSRSRRSTSRRCARRCAATGAWPDRRRHATSAERRERRDGEPGLRRDGRRNGDLMRRRVERQRHADGRARAAAAGQRRRGRPRTTRPAAAAASASRTMRGRRSRATRRGDRDRADQRARWRAVAAQSRRPVARAGRPAAPSATTASRCVGMKNCVTPPRTAVMPVRRDRRRRPAR